MSAHITHPTFKKVCGMCGKPKKTIRIGIWEHTMCARCDTVNGPLIRKAVPGGR